MTVFVPTAAANALGTQTILRQESYFGDERESTWDGFEVAVNARMRSGLMTQIGTSTGRGSVNTCETATKYNQVTNAALGTADGPNPRGCDNVEPWQTAIRGSASYTIPKIDVLVSAVVRSQPEVLLGDTPNTLRPPGRCRTR